MALTMSDPKSVAARYVEAAGEKDYDTLESLLGDDMSFQGPNTQCSSAKAYIAALKRMQPVWAGNRLREIFSNDDRVCVVYDFITNTQAGAIPAIELLTVRKGRIESVELHFDRVQFAPAAQALAHQAPK
jgi:hypothetical protein